MTKQLPEGSFNIMNGPEKFELMCSVFDGKAVKISCSILGDHKPPEILKVLFRNAGEEGGSYNSWEGTLVFVDDQYETEERRFEYSTETREGVIHPHLKTPKRGKAKKKI